MPRLAILLPPSEVKAAGGTLPGWDPGNGVLGPALVKQRRAVARALRRAKGGDEKLTGTRGEHLDRARAANRSLIGAPVLPAGERFTGVVWEHLDVATMSAAARRRASESVFVVSAVAGVVRIDEPLPDHRLKLSVSLDGLGKLSTYWREPLSAALNDELAGRLVVDLLPQEHAAAWTPDPSRYDLRRIRFVSRDGKPAGHFAKAAKGLLARHLLLAGSPARALDTFTHDLFDLDIS